jgi:hypothetical protein
MNKTRTMTIAIGLVVAAAGALSAQTQETKTTTKTKVEMKGGKSITVAGCLERRDNRRFALEMPFLGVKSLKTLSSSCS